MSQDFKGNGMGINLYNKVKKHYDETKPIRGKRASENIRPLNRRERTWERVVEDVRSDGAWYGYRLYHSDLVMISPTGIIELTTDGYETVSTAQFIDWMGRSYLGYAFNSFKKNNKIWVQIRGVDYPLEGKPTQFAYNEEGLLKPLKPISREVPVVDRKAMKEVMSVYMPMINYMNAMLRLTSGLLTYDMRKGLSCGMGNSAYNRDFIYEFSTGHKHEEVQSDYKFSSDEFFEVLTCVAETGDQEDWNKMLCVIGRRFDYERETVGQEEMEYTWGENTRMVTVYHYNYKLDVKPNSLRDRIARLVKNRTEEVWTSKTVNYGL